ncbi:MAG: hypothetical protein JSW27_16730 [Phycisphaerales bacterium]|nr:MAG: hypothetical protein JSW27_16730 [Phycisphaerales bacterium]
MRSRSHTFVVVTILAVLSSAWATETSPGPTVTISGVAGVPGVMMRGLPGAPTTDENGCYTARVPRGWSGTVIPTKKGYSFEPARRTYSNLQEGLQTEDYESVVLAYVISGNVGLPGVTLKGLPGEPISDAKGLYSAQVSYGWSGAAMPVKEGYRFDPPSLHYHRIARDCVSNDYKARIIEYTISGNVSLPGVTLQGLPGEPIADENGRYAAKVPYGWRGAVAPKKLGYEFTPPQKVYDVVKQSFDREDFEASALLLTISGNVGLDGVAIVGLPGQVVSDARGYYVARVPYGWSGKVTPVKQGCEFAPDSKLYRKTASDHTNENYTVRGLAVSPPASAAPSGTEVLVIPASQIDPKGLAEIKEDMQVMVHILREMLSEPRTILGILYDYGDIFGNSDRRTQAFYLEGYGALFVMKVDFPFSFPAAGEPKDESEQAVDPVWQRARQRLRSPGTRRAYGLAADEEMSFEQFKADLLQTLKHAANIRHIDPNENVILTIIGQDAGGRSDFSGAGGAFPGATGGAFGGSSYSVSGGSFGLGGGSTYATSRTYASSSAAPGAQTPARDPYGNVKGEPLGDVIYQSQPAPIATTVLTIRAKKSDIDAFSQGDIDFETFQQRVKVLSY